MTLYIKRIVIFRVSSVETPPSFHTKSIFKFFFGAIENERCCRTMRSIDCYECRYNHWGLGIGVGVTCVHQENQKYNPKRRKEGEEKNYHNSTTQVSRIPDGCELRKERD